MSVGACLEPVLEADVGAFLERRSLEGKFQEVCELARDCFPEVRALHVGLLVDPDEEQRTWVVLHVLLPAGHPADLLQRQRLRYHELLVEQLPLQYHPFFGLVLAFTSE